MTRTTMAPVAVLGGSPAAVWWWHAATRPAERQALLRFTLNVAIALGLFSAAQGALVGWGVGLSLNVVAAILGAAAVLAPIVSMSRRSTSSP